MLKRFVNVSLILLCTGCDPVTWVVGGTAAVGTATVRDKEGATGQVSDSYLKKKIEAVLCKKDSTLFDRIELAVKHGIVIVIGSFDDQSQCERAMEIVRSVKKDDVYDETRVEPQAKVGTFVVDSGITTRISSALTFDGNVSSLNYDLTTVNGVVYICGTAMSIYERDVVLNHARTTSGVKKVVAYIKINNEKD